MRIQHNIMAMSAYRNYTNNVSAMKKNLEKLSSGYKINRAGDDAAGLAISEKMRAQITGLETAQKNAKDGISLVQTAEGALTEVHDMLNRMVELATMSANGTYDNTTDRAQLQKEMDQLRSEIDRIADSANFNGINLLDGSMDGSGAGSKVEFTSATIIEVQDIKDGQVPLKEAQKGKYSVDFSQATLSNASTADATISFNLTGGANGASVGITLTAGSTLAGADIAKAFLNAISTASANTSLGTGVTALTGSKLLIDGITFNVDVDGAKLTFEMDEVPTKEFATTPISAKLTVSIGSAAGDFGNDTSVNSSQGEQFQVTTEREAVSSVGRVYAQASFTLNAASIVDGAAVKIGDTVYTFAVGADSKFKGAANVVDLTDTPLGASASLHDAAVRLAAAAKDNAQFYVGTNVSTGVISLTEKEGGIDYNKYNLAGADGKAVANGATAKGDATTANWGDLIQWGSADIKEVAAPGKSLTLQIGDTAEDFNKLKVNIQDMHVDSLGIDKISIADQDAASEAIKAIKNAINMVSDVRGTLGATQNRLDHTINNLSVMTENIQDAESTIRDTDVADEMMAYTKNNILIQSAQAMLAQANQVPQGVLQLLQ